MAKSPDKRDPLPFSTGSLQKGSSRSGPLPQIKSYKVLRELGEGGMGIVYLAEQQKPVRRKVALKIVKPGMDSKQVIARFEAEQQALALLDHPNIAHVIDAGTTETGRPYFVMEYVQGVPITEYCDLEKCTVEERLGLFLVVCEAVQHAHQKGIIHRDIKPTNILVAIQDEQAVPKIIDFGVAKAIYQPLTDRTLFTEQGQLIGTPEYMSPEQAEMTSQDIDTRSDIYSLGVLLYTLLTGALPFDRRSLQNAAFAEILRIIREEEPPTPSTRVSSLSEGESTKLAKCCRTDVKTIRRELRGDLDWITLRAMEKNRTRRYQTAHSLAEDIQRHLNHEPVLAVPPSKIYRLKKLLRKYKIQVVSAASVLVFALMGLTVTSMLLRSEELRREADRKIIEKERALVEQKAEVSLSAAETFYAEGRYEDAFEHVKQSLQYVATRLDAQILEARILAEMDKINEAITKLNQLVKDHPEEGAVYDLLAILYYELGNESQVKKYREKANQFSPQTTEAYYLRAITAETLEDNLKMLSQALKLDRQHLRSRKARAMAYYALNDYKGMERDADRVTFLQPANPIGYALHAIALRELGQYDEAVEKHASAIELTSEDDPVLAELYNQRRQTYFKNGSYEKALQDAEECVSRQPDEYRYRFYIFGALVALGHHEQAKDEYAKIDEFGSGARNIFHSWSAQFVFNMLSEGCKFVLPDRDVGGLAFSAIHEAKDLFNEYKSAGFIRLLPNAWSKSWSKDSTKLAYGRSDQYEYYLETEPALESQVPDKMGIRILDLSSGETWPLVSSGKDPRWSPDMKYIAYTRWPRVYTYEKQEVWVIPAEGGEPWRLAKGKAICWTGDSKSVYYHSNDLSCIYKKRFDDPDAKAKRVIYYIGHGPTISPDEKYLAYIHDNVLKIFELSSGKAFAFWPLPYNYYNVVSHIEWSPNGRELSIGSQNIGIGLWIYDLDTKTAAKVISGPANRGLWSPDSTKMAFEVRKYHQIWVANLEPNLPTVNSLGTERTIEQHYHEKIEGINKKVESDPCDEQLYLERATFYIYLQEEDKAFSDLEKYISINPSRAGQVYSNISWGLIDTSGRKGDPVIAVHLAKKAIEKVPKNWAYHSRLGAAQYYAGEYEDAISMLEQSEKMYAGNRQRSYPRNVAFIAMSLQQLGRSQEAEGALMKLRVRFEDGRNMSLRKYLIEAEQLFAGKNSKIYTAWDCIRTKRLNRALELLTDVSASSLDDDPNFAARVECIRSHLARGYTERGTARSNENEYGEAIAAFESAVKTSPSSVLALNNLAWLQASCPEAEFRNGTKAVEHATKACELTNFKDTIYIDTLAAAYAEAGDFEQAIKWQQKVIELLTEEQRSMYQFEFEARLKLYRAGQPYHRQPLFEKQMIARWTFDQVKGKNVLDSSDNDLHGKLVVNAKIISDHERGKVLSLDGKSDYVECGNSSIFNIKDEITVAAWIKINKFDKGWQTIIAKGDTAWRLSRDRQNNSIEFACTMLQVGGPGYGNIIGDANVNNGRWHHVCGTYDGANIRLYVDGKEDSASPATYRGEIGSNNYSVWIGNNSQRTGRYWNGLIDDVRIYSYALSEQEIKELYTSSKKQNSSVSEEELRSGSMMQK